MINKGKSFPLSEITAVSPLDGRYRSKIQELSPYLSEYALIKTRIEIEVRYLIALSSHKVIRRLSQNEKKKLLSFADHFSLEQAKQVKKLEERTRHDVKAMERTFREFLKKSSLKDLTEMIHIGLTSEDINNLATRLMLTRATKEILLPTLHKVISDLVSKAEQYRDLPMLARTHGQAAVPTTMGKELVIFADRLNTQVRKLSTQNLTGKMNGAVGNFNALTYTYPKTDWISFSKKFVSSLGLVPNLVTNQINPYDDMAEYFQTYQRINTVLIDMDQDIWRYISDGWFVQTIKKGEVGSSTMPQKVNPIDFENSEGSLGVANSIFEFLARKLMVSRLQRDLSDSTTIRNIGTAVGFSLIAYKSTSGGLSRIKASKEKINESLHLDWSTLTEGVQTLLRRYKVDDPYSLVAGLSRGRKIGESEWSQWIQSLPVTTGQKKELMKLSPTAYVGLAVKITTQTIKKIRKE